MFVLTTALLMAAQIEAIGPKQDDPRAACGTEGIVVQGGLKPIVVHGGMEAIGPKQDDPRKLSIGPKQDDPRKLSIGPKQDDPLKVGVLARPGDDNDPKASGGEGTRGIIVQGGREAIGPKQDDPRALKLGVIARPGDDNDPKARSCAPAAG